MAGTRLIFKYEKVLSFTYVGSVFKQHPEFLEVFPANQVIEDLEIAKIERIEELGIFYYELRLKNISGIYLATVNARDIEVITNYDIQTTKIST